ncbi:NAD(P)-dependent oxidoreductase [Kocuria sp. M1R5S2]|uniref:NAD(P)-dependent oxidoreductase n=1 Tax=Kocuria rhizosphaerae TaxID=3376285 RepID=UPI0037A81361
MRVTVFGASNDVGQAVVDHLVGRGFEVLAHMADRAPGPRRWGPDVAVTTGEITDAASVAEAVARGDVVVNALDPRLDRRARDGDLVEGTGHIVAAMQAHGVRRYIGLGGRSRDCTPTSGPPRGCAPTVPWRPLSTPDGAGRSTRCWPWSPARTWTGRSCASPTASQDRGEG